MVSAKLSFPLCTKPYSLASVALLRAGVKQNERDLFWDLEAVKQSSNAVWGARYSGSKSLAPLVNGRAYVVTVFWRKLVGVIPSPAGRADTAVAQARSNPSWP
jgi:hypothetical protein